MEETPPLAEWIIERTLDAVIHADRSGAIVRSNHDAAVPFGYGATEALGCNLNMVIPDHPRATHRRGFKAAMTSDRTRLHGRATLTSAIIKAGGKLYVEMTFAMVNNQEGEVVDSVAIARDVTAQVEHERSVARHGGET